MFRGPCRNGRYAFLRYENSRETMIPFNVAKELKSAGFTQNTSAHAIYALNDHLRIRRENALQMWYGSKAKSGVALQLEEEAVYTPTLSELVIACGRPLHLICNESGLWRAFKSAETEHVEGETAEEALGRLWLILQASA